VGLIFVTIIAYNDYKYEKYHKTVYEQADIKVMEIFNDKVIIIMADGTVIENNSISWSHTNDIFKEIKFYKDKTNMKYILKRIKL